MRVPAEMATAFDASFEEMISKFALERELLPEAAALGSPRFLARSVVPHVKKLSALFNREETAQGEGLGPYWKESSNPAHLRLAYFLYFMPPNAFRAASVWAELGRLGFRWPARAGAPALRAIELGAGPASGACGIACGERFAQAGLPRSGTWALIEQDKAMLELGSDWAGRYFASQGATDWGVRPFHRKLDIKQGFLPRNAPAFDLWLMSFFLNESRETPSELADALLGAWSRHLDDEGIVILIEPALKLQSRKLLELRRELLKREKDYPWLKILLPCLGHQACGALAAPEDWCHEEVSWWRPPYFRVIDRMAGLDRKSLPFSYLVIARSERPLEEILPAFSGTRPEGRHRLVSPAHSEGQDLEFFICGQDGKRRARFRPGTDEAELGRGSVLLGAEYRGDTMATRIDRVEGML